MVPLPLPRISPADVENARQIVARHQDPKAKQPTFLETVKATRCSTWRPGKESPPKSRFRSIALGSDLAWVSLPGEIFVELGLAIKQDSPFAAHDHRRAGQRFDRLHPHAPGLLQGNYEVVSARCAEGSGELLVDTAIRLLKELHAALPRATATSNRPGNPGRG